MSNPAPDEKQRKKLERFDLPETFLSPDFAVGLASAGGGLYVAYWHPERLDVLVTVLAALAAVVVGTAIAGVAVQAALMSDAFLRRVSEIGKEPTYYLRHWVFSVTLGVLAALSTGFLAGVPKSAPTWLRVTACVIACLFTGWVFASLLAAVTSLKGFVRLRTTAAKLDDEWLPCPRSGPTTTPRTRSLRSIRPR